MLRERDTLKVTPLGRLSRSVLHLVTLGADLRERGVGLHVIEKGINTSSLEGRAGPALRCGSPGRAAGVWVCVSPARWQG
ncbi:recombinase family protein [Streptomyces sp. NPDC090045]|uniref:recombinase family protein n=1 Tax=Streptomyces sp. NPDC090045 TaxID=3365927 RepID=UPI00381A87EC